MPEAPSLRRAAQQDYRKPREKRVAAPPKPVAPPPPPRFVDDCVDNDFGQQTMV